MVILSALACGLFTGAAARAGDWPQWGGTNAKNMASAETGLPETFDRGEKDTQGGGVRMETTRNVRWAVRLGAMTVSTPAVAGGRIFLGTMRDEQGILLCLDEATGRTLWQWSAPAREVPGTIDGRRFEFARFPKQLGVCSSPAVDGDRVYFVNQRLEVMCLSVTGRPYATGPAPLKDDPKAAKTPWPPAAGEAEVLWTFDLWSLGVRPSDACDCSPVVDEKFVYVLTGNGVDRQEETAKHDEDRAVPAPDAPNVAVLDKRTGRLVATDDVRFPERMLHGQWSSPSLGRVGDKTHIYFGGGDGRCYAFEAPEAVPADGKPVTLKRVWWVDCVPREYQQAVGAMPLITHYCLGDERRSDSLNKKSDGTFEGMSEIIATPAFYNNRVYIAIGRDPAHGRGRGALWCIDATGTGDRTETGRVWCYQGLDRSLSTVSISGGLVYAADVAGRIHCLDAKTGKVYWVHDGAAQTWGSTLVADGKVYLGTEKGLWVLAAGKELKVFGKINLGAPIWATPVAANGTLLVASKTYLYAVQKGP